MTKTIQQYSKVKVVRARPNLEYTLGEGRVGIGDVGTVIEIYKAAGTPDGYEVECVMEDGGTNIDGCFLSRRY